MACSRNLRRGEAREAARDAELVVEIEPFRESAYRLLMRALEAGGDRAEALRVYERCRTTIAPELGVDPSAETEALFLDIVRST